MNKRNIIIRLLFTMCCLWVGTTEARTYTEEHPLVYENMYDLWPYSFRNEKGQPDGFNVELVRMLLKELGMTEGKEFVIKMNSTQQALDNLKEGTSDLTMGIAIGYHDAYGHYGRTSVTLFTQSVLSPKSAPTNIRNFKDLATHKVYVNDSSLCHHLMIDYGFAENAVPTKNIEETIHQMSINDEGELVWNTLSLKWLLRKFHINNLEISPINMPHGEFRFMSNDDQLLARIDSVYNVLDSREQFTPLHNKWFYPEHQEKVTPQWIWYTCAVGAFLLLILIIYTLLYIVKLRQVTYKNHKLNRRLALILETSGVRMWTYDIPSQTFIWRNEYGQPAYVYTFDEFANRYTPEDFQRLTDALQKLANMQPKDGKEETITLNIKAKDAREDGDNEMHDFTIVLSVLRRDKHQHAVELLGTKKNITEKRALEQKDHERSQRYWAIFETPLIGILFFDSKGILVNINDKACQIFGYNRNDILQKQPTLYEIFQLEEANGTAADELNLQQLNGFQATQMKSQNEYRFMTVDDEEGQPFGLFAFCNDMSYIMLSQEQQQQSEKKLNEVTEKEKEYIEAIDDFIGKGRSRVVSYSPTSHMLTIYNASEKVQLALTPTRLITLIDDRMTNKVMRILSNMDAGSQATIDTDIRTVLRIKGGLILHIHILLLPQYDEQNNVKEYLGMLQDISQQKAYEAQLANIKAQTQEIEDTKATFIRNMMQEIRTPLSKVIDNATQLTPVPDSTNTEHEQNLSQAIISNADHLTHIIDNILFLSRLEAHMIEIRKQPTDFAAIFNTYCEKGWEKYKQETVRYIVENPYEQLEVNIDADHLGHVISQLTQNAAQHTHSGAIRVRYDYIGRRLMISVDDTGDGIPSIELARLNGQLGKSSHTSNGLGLPICKELLIQMGGNLEMNSEEKLGTTVWITLPCAATVVKRKKLL